MNENIRIAKFPFIILRKAFHFFPKKITLLEPSIIFLSSVQVRRNTVIPSTNIFVCLLYARVVPG